MLELTPAERTAREQELTNLEDEHDKHKLAVDDFKAIEKRADEQILAAVKANNQSALLDARDQGIFARSCKAKHALEELRVSEEICKIRLELRTGRRLSMSLSGPAPAPPVLGVSPDATGSTASPNTPVQSPSEESASPTAAAKSSAPDPAQGDRDQAERISPDTPIPAPSQKTPVSGVDQGPPPTAPIVSSKASSSTISVDAKVPPSSVIEDVLHRNPWV